MAVVAIHLVPYYYTVCAEEDRPYCLNYMNSSGELAVTRFTYSRGRNDKAFYQNITGGRSSRNFHEFDETGRMVRKYREYNDGETSEELFRYDIQGRLISESFESSKGVTGGAVYEYNGRNQARRMICKGYKGWLQAEITFSFDRQGKRLSANVHQDGDPAGTIEYSYDRKQNLVKEHWVLGSGWTQTFQYVYEAV